MLLTLLSVYIRCVIWKCSDSCSRSQSFDLAVDVINGASITCKAHSYLSLLTGSTLSHWHTHNLRIPNLWLPIPQNYTSQHPRSSSYGGRCMGMRTWIAKIFEELKTSLKCVFLLPVLVLPPFILFWSTKFLFSFLGLHRLYRLTSQHSQNFTCTPQLNRGDILTVLTAVAMLSATAFKLLV